MRTISQVQAPGRLFLEGRFNGGFFALPVWGGFYLEGLIHGGAYFRNFTVALQVLDLLFLLLFFFMPELTLNEIVEYGISKSRKFRNSSGSSNK